jgi:hypothetical protein
LSLSFNSIDVWFGGGLGFAMPPRCAGVARNRSIGVSMMCVCVSMMCLCVYGNCSPIKVTSADCGQEGGYSVAMRVMAMVKQQPPYYMARNDLL